MPATALQALTPYVPWGTRKFYWVDTIANLTAPSRTELNAGTDLTPQVTEAAGWSRTGTTVDSQSFVGPAIKLAGPSTLEDSSLTMRLSKTGTDIRDVVEFGDSGYVVVFPDGDTAGRTMDVFQVTVTGDPKSQGATDAATVEVQFAPLAAEFSVTVP